MSRYVATCEYTIREPSERISWISDPDNSPDLNQMMNEVRKWSSQNNKYPFVQSNTHNLLLMGKTRTGKTTIAKVLENPCYVPPDAKLYSETREVTIHPIATINNIINCFNIIDTPGMFDKVKRQNKLLTNQRIKRAINKCLEEDVTNIHLFGFVISLENNIDNEDIDSMIFVKENYPLLNDYICLIVTHSEETHYQQRQEKVNLFFQSEKVIKHNLKDLFGKRIFFMGSLRSQLVIYPNKESVRQQIQNVHQMREIFLDYIINLDPNHYFNIHHLNNSNICILL